MGNNPSERLKGWKQERLSVVLERVSRNGLRGWMEQEPNSVMLLEALEMVVSSLQGVEAGQDIQELEVVCVAARWLVEVVDRRQFHVAWDLLDYAWDVLRRSL